MRRVVAVMVGVGVLLVPTVAEAKKKPKPVKYGTVVKARHASVAVFAYTQPATPAHPDFTTVPPGKDLAVVEVQECALDRTSLHANPLNFTLELPNHTRLSPSLATTDPQFDTVEIAGKGDCVRGTVGFMVPVGVRGVDVVFTENIVLGPTVKVAIPKT